MSSEHIDLWLMRQTVANYFGGISADKEVQDLDADALGQLYDQVMTERLRSGAAR